MINSNSEEVKGKYPLELRIIIINFQHSIYQAKMKSATTPLYLSIISTRMLCFGEISYCI